MLNYDEDTDSYTDDDGSLGEWQEGFDVGMEEALLIVNSVVIKNEGSPQDSIRAALSELIRVTSE